MRKLRFLLFFLAVMPSCHRVAVAMTLGDIKVQVRRLVNDKADPKLKFTDAEITTLANESQRNIVNETWCLSNRTSQSITTQTTYYAVPTDFIAATHVQFRDYYGHVRELTEISEQAEEQTTPDYERISGPPMTYFVRNSTVSTTYTTEMAVLPVASSSIQTGTVIIDYVNQATDLSADTDIPFDGLRSLYPYHYAIVYDVSAKLKLMKGDASAATDLQLAQAYIAMMKNRLGQAPNYNPGFSPATSSGSGK